MNDLAGTGMSASRLAAPVLLSRLDSIRLALGSERLAVVRRLPAAPASASPPLEVLGHVGERGILDPPESDLPLEFVLELVAQARALEFAAPTAPVAWAARLERWKLGWIAGWPLPSDRLPSVFFVAMRTTVREPGAVRREVANAGMEALARLLAPPRWLPLGALTRPTAGAQPDTPRVPELSPEAWEGEATGALVEILARVEKEILVDALQAAEGNKSLAARKLRVSRQGLYRKLRRHGLMRRRRRALDTDGGDD